MPILEKEPDVFPEHLLDMEKPCNGARWWVAHTKPRQEKSLARQLLAKRVSFYLPQMAKTNVIRGRNVESHVPIFNGYVFVHGSEEQRYESLTTKRVAQVLPVDDQYGLHADLQRVRTLTASGLPLFPEERLGPGARVRITSGPLMGLEGEVVSSKGRHRFLVAVNFIQQGVSVEIDADALEPVASDEDREGSLRRPAGGNGRGR